MDWKQKKPLETRLEHFRRNTYILILSYIAGIYYTYVCIHTYVVISVSDDATETTLWNVVWNFILVWFGFWSPQAHGIFYGMLGLLSKCFQARKCQKTMWKQVKTKGTPTEKERQLLLRLSEGCPLSRLPGHGAAVKGKK